MTNEEIKKKIVEVISQKQTYGIKEEFKTEDLGHRGWQAWTETTKVNNAEIAEALIAAGLTFGNKHRVFVENAPILTNYVGNECFLIPNTSPTIKQLYGDEEVEQIVKERDTCKRALELAERAFDDLANEIYQHDVRPICDKEFFKQARFEQAEKELQEEGKE